MDNTNKEVETKVEEASTQQEAVEKSVKDAATLLAEKDVEIAKLSEERNNYKKGMLKAKGKLDDDEDVEESIDDKVARIVKEKLSDGQIIKAQQDKDEIIKQVLARNKELETAIKNRSQISNAGMGSSSDEKLIVKDNILTPDQIKTLKAKGFDDKKIELFKKNLAKQQ